jgi:uncharacterized protein
MLTKKKWFHVVAILALVFSLFTPFSQNISKAADVITVAQAISSNSGNATVEGYIVGFTKGTNSYQFTGPFTGDTNIAIADRPNETDPAKILPVQLPSGAIRTALNLKTNPENLGKKVQITGSLDAYFTTPGLKSPTWYSFVETTNPTKVSEVTAAPGSGGVVAGESVTLTTATEGATIFYSTNGDAPSTPYTQPITINENTTIKAFATAEGLENSDIATFDYTILSLKTIAEVRALPLDSEVITKGTITYIAGRTVYFQDATAGIVLFSSGNVPYQVGDVISVKGTLTDYNSLLEIEANLADVKKVSTSNTEVSSEVLPAAQLQESKEAKLVTIKNVTIESFASGNYTAQDAEGTSFQIRPADASLLEVNTKYDAITGVLGAYRDVYQLIPRGEHDIVHDSTVVRPVVATPGTGMVKKGDTVTLSTPTAGAVIHYTTDGSTPTVSSPVYSNPIVINEDQFIKAIAVKEGLKDSKLASFEYVIQEGPIRIHDIQGARHYSMLDGKNVTDVEGVVTYVDSTSRFYIQDLQGDDNPKTSDGILVYKTGHGKKVGDLVKVTGTVVEYYGEGYDDKRETDLTTTQIEASTITVIGTAKVPAPIVIGEDRVAPTEIIDNDSFGVFDPEQDGIDFYESLEGMLVQVKDAKILAPQKNGELQVVPGNVATNTDAGGLRITATDYNPEKIAIDINSSSFVAKMGDRFEGAINGVVNYGYGNYKILAKKAELPTFVEGTTERETTKITPEEDKLTIASYNVENFSTKTSAEKVGRVAEAIVANMKKPDIIGLVEVQDNDGDTNSGTVDATESAQKLINQVVALGGPEYVYTDIAPVDREDGGAPGGNIRVGFLYNPERVSLTPGTKGSATDAVGFENGKLTLNPGRIDPTNPAFESSRKPLAAQFEFQGKSVIVVANHFNSKGGDQPLFGKNQPPFLGSEAQRLEIAKIVNGFVRDIKSKDANANVVLLGDFNDFEFTPALKTVKGQELVNMIEKVPAGERYTYSFNGNAQVLDHILVSKNMEANTTVDIVNINSGFMEEHGRASDHDPVIIQTELKEVIPATLPKGPVKEHKLVGFNKKKLVVAVPSALIDVDGASEMREGILLKGDWAKLSGEGLKNTLIIISPNKPGAVIDLGGLEVKEVLIDSANVKEIRGAENVQLWSVSEGVDPSKIIFTNAGGQVMNSPILAKAS